MSKKLKDQYSLGYKEKKWILSMWAFILLFVSLIISTLANSAPYAITNEIAYDEQIISCNFTVNGSDTDSVAPLDTGSGYKCFLDVGQYANTGTITIVVKACNVWDCSADSPLFSSITTVPTAPSVIGLSPAVP